MAHGKPAIVTSLGGLIEVVEPDVDSMLIDANSPDSIVEVVLRMEAAGSKRSAMGRAARENIRKKFSPAKHVESLTHLYAKRD